MVKQENGAKYLFPTEIVAGIFCFLPKRLLSNKLGDIHPVFYRMRQKGLLVLRDFRFKTSDIFPYSETLGEAVSNLLGSKTIWLVGSDLDRYEIGDALIRYFENFVKPRLSKKQIKEMRRVAKALKKFCY